MRRAVLAFALPLLLGSGATVAACARGGEEPRPALVVVVSVDQLRADLLDRYDSLFTGGFRRLLDGGYRFTNAVHDHSATETAVGHATLATGVFPSRHGIVANTWIEAADTGWRAVYAAEDTLALILGHPAMEGRSPANLLRGGIADWIAAADSAALVVSVSKKDRAAIGLAGKSRGYVFWLSDNEGQFVTSSYYMDRYPGWVERFNREVAPRLLGDTVWTSSVPEEARSWSRPDTAAYEGDGEHTYFPHRFSEEGGRGPWAQRRWAARTPMPDAAVEAFAETAVRELGLGADEVTDYLALSFSQTDYVGHGYGPLSREQLDNLLRLDRTLGRLLTFLDQAVGPGRWVLALSADHGVLTIPEALREEGVEARRASRQDLLALRNLFRALQAEPGDPAEKARKAVERLRALPFVAEALTFEELTTRTDLDSLAVFRRNSHRPGRWIGRYGSQGIPVAFWFRENYLASPYPTGTSHGSPYYYDRHVPLVFYGAGVEPGVSADRVRTVDLAPTLATLAGVEAPPDLDGRSLF